MTKKVVVYCSLCEKEIGKDDEKDHHNLMARINFGKYQQWPTPDGDIIDVCATCCVTLYNAKRYGIAEYDIDPIMERAGFVKSGDLWIEK